MCVQISDGSIHSGECLLIQLGWLFWKLNRFRTRQDPSVHPLNDSISTVHCNYSVNELFTPLLPCTNERRYNGWTGSRWVNEHIQLPWKKDTPRQGLSRLWHQFRRIRSYFVVQRQRSYNPTGHFDVRTKIYQHWKRRTSGRHYYLPACLICALQF